MSDPRGRVCRALTDTDVPHETFPAGKHGPSGTASRGRKPHRVPGRRCTDTSRKIPVRPSQRCLRAVGTTSTVGLASGPPGGRRAASTLDRATRTVCHMGRGPGQSSRRQYPEGDERQTDGPAQLPADRPARYPAVRNRANDVSRPRFSSPATGRSTKRCTSQLSTRKPAITAATSSRASRVSRRRLITAVPAA